MHRPSADLDAAVAFVVERISQEAEHSAVPLDDDETHFLNQLPSEPRNPTAALAFRIQYGLRILLADSRSAGPPIPETLQVGNRRTLARS